MRPRKSSSMVVHIGLMHLLVLGAALSIYAQDIQIDFAEASPLLSIDLDKTPATRQKTYLSLIPAIADYISQSVNATRFDREISNYLRSAERTLANNTGVLVQIRVYSDGSTNYLPSTFFIPLATGHDPIDAYSEFANRSSFMPAPPQTPLVDASYFLWINKISGEIAIANIPREFTEALVQQGMRAAQEKTRLNSFCLRELPSTLPNFAGRASYWNGQLQVVERDVRYAERLEQITSLIKQYLALQKEFGGLVQKYESLKAKQSANKSFLNTVEIALKIGTFIVNNGSIFTGESQPGLSYDPKIIRDQNDFIAVKVNETKGLLELKESEISELEKRIKRQLQLP